MREQLVAIRKEKKLTQKQVAEHIGISEVFVRMIENGSRNPGRETMLKFELLFGKSDRELFPDLFFVPIDTKCIK